MPWKTIGKKVIKSDTGKLVKEHDTVEQAEKHVKALYANYKGKSARPQVTRRDKKRKIT